MPGPTFRSTLEELARHHGEDMVDAAVERALDSVAEVDPLPSLLPPEGIVACRIADVVEKLSPSTRRLDVAGVKGAAAPAVAAAIARSGRPVVLVAGDLDETRRLAEDTRFLLGPSGGSVKPERSDAEAAEDTGAGDVLVLSAPESSPYADVNPDRRAAMSRMATLLHLSSELPWSVLAMGASGLVRKVVPRRVLTRHTMRVIAEDALDRELLLKHLGESGYLRVPVVEDPGSFAVRGAILDLWPPNTELPARIETYGDLVVSIQWFDPYDQKTQSAGGAVPRDLYVPPAREVVLTRETIRLSKERVQELCDKIDWPTSKARALVDDVATGRAFFGAEGYLPAYYETLDSVFDYIPGHAVVVLVDPPRITSTILEELERTRAEAVEKRAEPIFSPESFVEDEAALTARLEQMSVVSLHGTPVVGSEASGLAQYEVCAPEPMDLGSRDHEDLSRAVKAARASKGKTSTLEPLARRVAHWQDFGLRVFLTARAQTQAERLAALLRHQDVRCRVRLGPFQPKWLTEPLADEPSVEVVTGPLSRGAAFPSEGVVLVTEEEVFGARSHRRRERKSKDPNRPFLEDLRSLSIGDFVVHADHGIGRYLGLVHRDVGGLTVDLLAVEYAGGDKLYLPAYRLNQIQKYAGGENAEPKVDRLGGSTFSKTKSRVKKAVRQMADELLKLYAERQAQPGFAQSPIDDDYRAFEATFPFDETPDQARAIDEVNQDLETARPMDRLVCGDVGFGKTEVAIRAAFRVAHGGKQVALLCPTTVLAQQHLRTFESRMRDYPLVLRGMSRFQSKKEQDETVLRLKEGRVDVVIGTHRLLSRDIHFRDLGLLIVDEEQRFGVAHKERIKQLRAQVDVLTLTATPIPRTLQMAVSGLRDLSLITTPPVDRRAVRTVVSRFDEGIIKEALTRELSRGGQVFYVYNRVEGIYERAQRLERLLPQARVVVGHGQMSEAALEKVMLDFVEGRFDVLVATAIIESGLDIPRANTMIIDRADLFGLAQLYQLRGRVGRAKERAYCYLLVPPANAMTDEARSRIEALERHTELGSGFKIASLDLELRGAGDLLGGEQSGNVASVGFDLFCQMLEEAVHELRGEPVVHDVDPELSFDVSALLPEDYVGDVGVRLSLYKRLASALDETHVSEIAVEMEDRFGPPPEEARRLVQLMTLKTELRKLRVLGCEANARQVTLHLREDTPLDPKKVLELVRAPKSPYRITPDMRLTRRFDLLPVKAQTAAPLDGEANGLTYCETVLNELARCLRAEA